MKNLIKKFKNLKISRKLFICNIGIIVIMTLLLGGVGYSLFKNILISKSMENSEKLLEQLNANFNYSVGALEDLVMMQTYTREFSAMIRSAPSDHDDLSGYDRRKKIESYGYNLINLNKYIKTVLIRDSYGNVYYSSEGPKTLTSNEQETCLNYDTAYDMWGTTYWMPFDDNQVFASRLIFDYLTMKPVGAVSIGVDTAYFKELYANVVKEDASGVILLNQTQDILLSSDEKSRKLAEFIIQKYPSTDRSGQEIYYKKEKYICTAWVTEGQGIQAMNLISGSAITAAISQLLKPLLFVAFLAIILAAVLAAVISGQISLNINLLLENIRKLSKGDFSPEIVPDSYDEIGLLAEEFNRMSQQIQNLLTTVTNEKILKKSSEIKALQFEYDSLQAKINPHFLYNTLESINSLAKINGQEKIADSIYLLGNYLREAISSKHKFVPLWEETQNIKNYVEIQKLSYGEKLNVDFDLDESLMDTMVPKLILQPLVENSIVHGIEPKIGHGHIKISSYCVGKDMCLTVWDDGVGIPKEKLETALEQEQLTDVRHTKVGLMAVHKRIRILYGDAYGVTGKSETNCGTVITVRLPIKFEDEVDDVE